MARPLFLTLLSDGIAVRNAIALLDETHKGTGYNLSGVALWSVSVALSIIFLCLMCRFWLAAVLACAFLNHQGRSRFLGWTWRSSCFLASFLPTSAVLIVLALLVVYTARTDVPANGIGLILAVAAAVVGSHVDRQVNGGYAAYWEKIHDSLRAALTGAAITFSRGYPTCQLTRFNTTHSLIHDRDGRQDALSSILHEPVCTRRHRCTGHGGKLRGMP